MRRPGAVVWLTLEKRYNFEVSSLSVKAYGYRRFLEHIGRTSKTPQSSDISSGGSGSPGAEEVEGNQESPALYKDESAAASGSEPDIHTSSSSTTLSGRLLPLNFPKCFDYHRVPQLELWEITVTKGSV